MENENYEKKPSLLSRLCARYHNSKIFKSILGLTLATTMATTMVACDSNGFFPSDTGNNTEQTQHNSTSNNSTESSTNTSTDGTTKPDLNEYSEILQYVLTDSYYNNVISNLKNGAINKASPYLDPHPYAFLDDEGYDIEQIKNGQLKCTTKSFVKPSEPNNLYIATYIETKAETPYYTEYLLKYNLTDQEMADYNMTHKNNYIQAVFMNDAVSEFKTPTIVSEAKCTIVAHESLSSELSSSAAVKKIMNNEPIYGILLKNVDPANDIFEIYVFGWDKNNMIANTKMALIPLTKGMETIKLDENGALKSCYKWGKFNQHESFSLTENEDIKIYLPYASQLSTMRQITNN